MTQLETLAATALKFRHDRDWEQFHTPKDQAIGLALEASEVLEHFQWKDTEQARAYLEGGGKLELRKELADVMIYLLMMSSDLGIDLERAVLDKLAENERKYPVEKAKGRADKYTAYQET